MFTLSANISYFVIDTGQYSPSVHCTHFPLFTFGYELYFKTDTNVQAEVINMVFPVKARCFDKPGCLFNVENTIYAQIKANFLRHLLLKHNN